jgi:Periplasmic serine proteases (ClpP class)
MNLLRTILTSPWMIDERTAQAAFPFVIRLMAGDDVTFNEESDRRPFAFSASSMRKAKYFDFGNAPNGSVAVFPVIGTVTKYGGWCSRGTEDLMLEMSKADEMENIAGHLIEIDSGGGEGTNLETVARFIRDEIQKPVVAWFNGTAASAAYYIACAADEIYASEETDIVGSIGVMFSMADWRTYFESKGVKIHEVYASQSDLKNKDIREALTCNP